MKPAPFDYVAAATIEQAVDLLARSDREAKVLAGGQSLLPVLNMRMGHPDVLVDIARIPELRELSVAADGTLRIGAAVTQTAVMTDPAVRQGWPMLASAIAHIGHPQIRNRGTVCGSLAHNDPAAELPAVAVALDATLTLHSSRGVREVSAEQMFIGPFMTAMEPDELLGSVSIPAVELGAGWSLREFVRRRGDFAAAGIAVRLERRDGLVADPRVVLFALGGSAQRARGIEQALLGEAPTEALLQRLIDLIPDEVQPADDIHGSARFRTEVAGKLLTEAVTEAWERSA